MVIVNRIVNILILLAAIAAAVFSYMLFSKREKLLDGWKQMATAIQTTAKTMDDGGASGTAAAKDLPVEKMLHTNYEQLGQVLPKLNKNAKDLITQRNDLASAMEEVAIQVKADKVKADGLRNVGSYKDQMGSLKTQAKNFRTVSDSVTQEYCNTGRIFGVSTNVEHLRSSATYRTAAKKINAAASEAVSRRNNYQNYLTQFSKAARVKTPNFVGGNYKNSLENTRRQILGKLSELDRANDSLKREQALTKNLREEIKSRNKIISARDGVIKARNIEIARLKNILSKDGTLKLPEKILTAKDVECYSYVRGKIQYVDADYGFVVINIGDKFTFVQQAGISPNRVHFPVKQNWVLTVIRGYGSEKPQTLGKIKVTKVEANSSVCNLLDGNPALYKVGDDVICSEDDVALITGSKKSGSKK